MTKKSTTNLMRTMGTALAVCSAVAFMGSTKANSSTAKKTMKKATQKMTSLVDTVASFM
jgi:hypothetical protein